MVEGFSIIGIGITEGETSDAGAQMFFCLFQFPATQVQTSERQIAACIAGIATQPFSPVGIGHTRRMAVLLEVQASYKQLIGTCDVLGRRRLRRRGRNFTGFAAGGGVTNDLFTIHGEHPEREIR